MLDLLYLKMEVEPNCRVGVLVSMLLPQDFFAGEMQVWGLTGDAVKGSSFSAGT